MAANVVLAKLYLPLAHYNFDMPTALLLRVGDHVVMLWYDKKQR